MKDQFREKAKVWDKVEWKITLADEAYAEITKNKNINKKAHLVDIGGGTGLLSLKFANAVNKITIIDTSESMLNILSQKLELTSLTNVSIIKDYFTSDTFQSKTIDIVISMMTLHHIPDLELFFSAVFDALKDDGAIAFIDLETENGDFHMEGVEYFHNGFNINFLRELLLNVGFRDIKIEPKFTVRKKSKLNELKTYSILFFEATK